MGGLLVSGCRLDMFFFEVEDVSGFHILFTLTSYRRDAWAPDKLCADARK